MGPFKSDLYRNFGIGFAVGAILVGAGTIDDWDGDIASPALAAEQGAVDLVQPTGEFLIDTE